MVSTGCSAPTRSGSRDLGEVGHVTGLPGSAGVVEELVVGAPLFAEVGPASTVAAASLGTSRKSLCEGGWRCRGRRPGPGPPGPGPDLDQEAGLGAQAVTDPAEADVLDSHDTPGRYQTRECGVDQLRVDGIHQASVDAGPAPSKPRRWRRR